MTLEKLISEIGRKKSFLCVGLDTDPEKIPSCLHDFDNPVLEFNRRIIDATRDFCVSYKINTAFFEAQGTEGWETLLRTEAYIGAGHFKIADAKRGDIGNTSDRYAKAFFEEGGFDAVTVAPYMGHDSVSPFLKYENKYAILLALTSNPGADDFQLQKLESGQYLFEKVTQTAISWPGSDRLMLVVGATRPEYLQKIRALAPNAFLLVPGVGAQGGSLSEVVKFGKTEQIGLLINASRSVIYASNGEDFAEKAGEEAKRLADEMAVFF
jgi:orotidine-5'-phosphate decarboxylase